MVEYYIEAIDQQGRPQTLMLSAKNSTMADELVRSQGLMPTLITHAKSQRRLEQEQAHARRRRRQFGLGGGVLVGLVLLGGVGLRVYIERLESTRGFTLDAIRVAGRDAGVQGRAIGADADLSQVAQDLFGAIHLKFPGFVTGINIKSESVMFVYVDRSPPYDSVDTVRLVTRAMLDSVQVAFNAEQCSVLVIENGVTVADARHSRGSANVNLHVSE